MKRVIFLVSLVFTALLQASPLVIFDAGSSGTRIYLYEVEDGQAKLIISAKAKPGLSSLDPQDTQALNQYFYNLVKALEGQLEPETKAETPIYLYATAGMRMLPEEEQTTLFTAAHQALVQQAKDFGYPAPGPEQVRAITGGEEALFIWLSGNYLSGNLKSEFLTARNTAATLEMGGASSEIAFISSKAKEETLPLPHQDRVYTLYGIAYDGLGANEALKTVSASDHPDFAACFPVGAPYPLDNPSLIGTGIHETCVRALKAELIDPERVDSCTLENRGHCSQLGEYQPRITGARNYILTSAFYYLFNTLELADRTVDYATFQHSAKEFCAKTWDEIQDLDQDPSILINYCFNAALTQTLFDAWHLKRMDRLNAVSSIEGVNLEWPLGAALYLAQE